METWRGFSGGVPLTHRTPYGYIWPFFHTYIYLDAYFHSRLNTIKSESHGCRVARWSALLNVQVCAIFFFSICCLSFVLEQSRAELLPIHYALTIWSPCVPPCNWRSDTGDRGGSPYIHNQNHDLQRMIVEYRKHYLKKSNSSLVLPFARHDEPGY